MLKLILLILFLYIFVNKIETYNNQNELLMFTEISYDIRIDNIKCRKIMLTRDRSEYLYKYLFNVNNINNENVKLKAYLERVNFVKDNNLVELIIKKINRNYNLNLDMDINLLEYKRVMRERKLLELNKYFSKSLINDVIINVILVDNSELNFDEYIINKLLNLNLINYDVNEINVLLENTGNELSSYILDKFNKEYSNIVIYSVNKIRNLVFIGEINI